MYMQKIIFGLFLLLSPCFLLAQGADLPLNHDLYHYIDRLDVQGRTGQTVHTDQKPYSRSYVSDLFEAADTSDMGQKEKAWHHLMRVSGDDSYANSQLGKGFLKYFYLNNRDLFYLKKERFKLYINPALYFSAGTDQHNYTTDGSTQSLINYRNTRGLKLRGTLFDKVGFYSEISENQVKYPQFVRNQYEYLGTLPGENFVKEFDKGTGNSGYDYFNARGYITYSPVKELRLKLGKDRAFWGNGRQSLLLSDQATDYFFLNLNTKIWKLEYVNTFAQMTDFIQNKPDSYGTYPKKWSVFHQLLYKPKPWLSVGFFESVVYSPNLPGGQRGFELEYLNPIIFYRSVEQSLGSPDNSMMGFTWKVNALKRFQSYGQIILDDLNFRVRNVGTGYIGNKYGYQLGLKYIDAFWLKGLDLQMEYNRVRPYTYSHFNPSANYSHYGQYLAHAAGANLHDFHFALRYQPFPKWSAYLSYTKLVKGLDINGENYGGNIFRSYSDFFQEYNNNVTQGEQFVVSQLQGRLSYRLFKLDAYAELEGRYRKENTNRSLSILGTLRFNLPASAFKY